MPLLRTSMRSAASPEIRLIHAYAAGGVQRRTCASPPVRCTVDVMCRETWQTPIARIYWGI